MRKKQYLVNKKTILKTHMMHAHRCLFKRARVSTRIRPASLSLSATFLYLLSPVDPRQNLAADVAVLSWL